MDDKARYRTEGSESLQFVQKVSVCPGFRLNKIYLACRGRRQHPDIGLQPALFTNKLAIYCSKGKSVTAEAKALYKTLYRELNLTL